MLRSPLGFLLLLVASSPGCGLLLDYDPPTDAPPLDAPGSDVLGVDVPLGACSTDGECPAPPGSGCTPICVEGRCDVSCANCVDLDLDGFGTGPECERPDCDDADPTLTDRGDRPCGGGGVGACRAGVQSCLNGLWSPCLDEVTPVAEVCNGLDDDCNGTADDLPSRVCGLGACRESVPFCASDGTPALCLRETVISPDDCGEGDEDCDGLVDEDCEGCVWVSPTGSGSSTTPTSPTTPLATVQDAIDWAADPERMAPPRVCLLRTALSMTDSACDADPCLSRCTIESPFPGDVFLRRGIAVSGGWVRRASGGVRQCRNLLSVIAPYSEDGIVIESAADGASLSNLRVTPASGSRSVGITVRGATGVVIAGVDVVTALNTSLSRPNEAYGVNVESDAEVTISGSSIAASNATAEAIGVRVVGATARLLDNCPPDRLVGGRCTAPCGDVAPRGVRGAAGSRMGELSPVSTAVLFRDAPGSSVLGSSVCAGAGTVAVGVDVDGPAEGTFIGGSTISGAGIDSGYGVRLGDGAGTSPSISDNVEISASGIDSTAVFAEGASAPVISGNGELVAGMLPGDRSSGVHCGPGARCVIVGNEVIRGAAMPRFGSGASGPDAVGVRCDGGCALVSDNPRIVGGLGAETIGLLLINAEPRVARNRISGGCGAVKSVGVWAEDAAARLENNLIFAATADDCDRPTMVEPAFIALWVSSSMPTRVLDVRSNDLFAPRFPLREECSSHGIYLASGRGGLFRGNIVDGGNCNSSFAVFETDESADPLGFSFNDLVPGPGVLYWDEGRDPLIRASDIDLLTDALCRGNLDADPGFVPGDVLLSRGSPCIDADGGLSPPADDHARTPRDGSPDIGAYEFVP